HARAPSASADEKDHRRSVERGPGPRGARSAAAARSRRGPVMTKTAARKRPAAPRRKTAKYLLRLYVTGTSGRSMRAIQNVRRICEEHLRGVYDLEVVDI